MNKGIFSLSVALLSIVTSGVAHADTVPPPSAPGVTLGGHLGLALPIVSFGSSTTGIGKDFFTVGISPGVTMKLDEHWSFDFELVAYNELKSTPSLTSFVVDPGVLYNLGPVVLGGRVATKIGGGQTTNLGVVPLVVLPFKVSRQLSYFIEGDVPVFFSDKEALGGGGGTGIQPSVGFQFQTGVAF